MAEPVLFLCWEDHITELSTVYKSLLENDFLVDCTISAEGQSLKAHRLVLSACSPYFHMLFREETEKHPFVILLNASFETLKAVIDFVYRGETHIPQSNLKAFLTLAQALKIKGLNAFSEDDMSKNLSGNPSGNASHGPPEDYQDSFEVQCISASQEDTHGNSSQQLLDSTDHYSNLAITNSSVPIVAYSVSCEEFQSSSAITTLQENQTSVEYNEDPLKTEDITLKQEPLLSPCSETRNNKADDSCGGSSHGTVESSGETLPQHLMQLSNKVSSARNVAEDHQSSEMIPKSEPVDNLESEEPMDHYDMPENDVYDTDERTGPSGGQQYFTPCPKDGAHPVVTYRDLFPVARKKGDVKAKLLSIVKDRLGFQECEERIEKCLKDSLKVFYGNFLSRWRKCHHFEHYFIKKYSGWLDAVLPFPEEVYKAITPKILQATPSTSSGVRRPRKIFNEGTERGKRKRITTLLESHSNQEIVYAARHSLHTSGKRDAANMLQEMTTTPTRATKIKNAYKKPRPSPVPFAAQEALAFMVESNFT